MARQAKIDHAAQYPGYQYAPRRPHQRPRRRPRIHPTALQFFWDTENGTEILENAAADDKIDGWVPVHRNLVQELDSQHLLTGPWGLGPPPHGPTTPQFEDLVDNLDGPDADQQEEEQEEEIIDIEEEDDIYESIDENFLEEILNFDD